MNNSVEIFSENKGKINLEQNFDLNFLFSKISAVLSYLLKVELVEEPVQQHQQPELNNKFLNKNLIKLYRR